MLHRLRVRSRWGFGICRSSAFGRGSVIVFYNRRTSTVFMAPAFKANASLRPLALHAGIDLAVPTGTPIVATADGVVGVADWTDGYGLLVSIEHGAGLETRYDHMSQLAVARGQTVRRGEVIGYVGSTGRSTGPHLHYEMRINGQAIDPRRR